MAINDVREDRRRAVGRAGATRDEGKRRDDATTRIKAMNEVMTTKEMKVAIKVDDEMYET